MCHPKLEAADLMSFPTLDGTVEVNYFRVSIVLMMDEIESRPNRLNFRINSKIHHQGHRERGAEGAVSERH